MFNLLKKNALRREDACHKIFIRSDAFFDKTDRDEDEDDDLIINVGQDKDQIQDIITSCLEEPLYKLLQTWREVLKRDSLRQNALDIIAEIETISNTLLPTKSKDKDVPIAGTDSIVPNDIKEYLLR